MIRKLANAFVDQATKGVTVIDAQMVTLAIKCAFHAAVTLQERPKRCVTRKLENVFAIRTLPERTVMNVLQDFTTFHCVYVC